MGFIHTVTAYLAVAVKFLVDTVGKLGYLGVFLLMAVESSFFPFPSEVVVPPAGYLASQGEMNLIVVIIVAVLGSIAGSLLNYYIALKLGRAFILRYAKYFFLTPERFESFERFFNTHGEITTFVGRLIPGVRQYISFPAGIVRMNLKRFIIFTALGTGIWCIVLAIVGYLIGNNMDLIKENVDTISLIVLPLLALLVIVYIIIHKRRNKILNKSNGNLEE